MTQTQHGRGLTWIQLDAGRHASNLTRHRLAMPQVKARLAMPYTGARTGGGTPLNTNRRRLGLPPTGRSRTAAAAGGVTPLSPNRSAAATASCEWIAQPRAHHEDIQSHLSIP